MVVIAPETEEVAAMAAMAVAKLQLFIVAVFIFIFIFVVFFGLLNKKLGQVSSAMSHWWDTAAR